MKNLGLKLINIFFLLAILSSCSKDSGSPSDSSPTNSGSGTNTGKAGSMARFTISGDNLYIVSNTELKVFDISNSSNPVPGKNIYVGTGLETIFPYNNYLFLGSQNGMHIYDISNPSSPSKLSTYNHVTSCDPVVVDGKYAYVTLRTSSNCSRGINQLEVIDISSPYSPNLLKSYPMTQPKGLGIDSCMLFVCDEGLKVYNATNPLDLKLTNHFKDVSTFDVIPKDKVLMLIGSDGLYQYDYSNREELKLLSTLMVEK